MFNTDSLRYIIKRLTHKQKNSLPALLVRTPEGSFSVYILTIRKDVNICYYRFYSFVSMAFHINAARMAPVNGPTINTHRSAIASPHSKSAGPIERAGFTDVPV